MRRITVLLLLTAALFSQNALIGGKVVDDSGEGISDLNVYILSYSMLFDSVLTDADGNWEMGLHAPDTVIVFPVVEESVPGYIEPEMLEYSVLPGDTITDIDFVYHSELALDASISGNISFASGEPASDVFVTAMNDEEDFFAVTDEEGNYSISVPSGTFSVFAYLEGYECSPDIDMVTLSEGESVSGIDFTMFEESEGISGYVYDTYGEPMSDIMVIAEDPFGLATSTATNMSGFYTLAIEPGDWGIYVSTTEYTSAPERYLLEYFPGVPTSGYDFVLTPMDYDAVVSGEVTYEYGEPAGYVSITASSGTHEFSAYTDYDGTYSIGLTEGTYTLTVEDDYYVSEPLEYEITVVDGDVLTGYDFLLSEYTPDVDAWITGRVTDGEEGISGVEIYAYDFLYDYETYSNSEGYYILGVIGGGELEIYCWEEGYTVEPYFYSEYISVGDTVSGLDFVLTEIGPPDAAIEGRVTFRDGSPAPGQYVYGYSYFGYEFEAMTDASGDYSLDVLGGETYEIYCDSWEYMSTPDMYEVSIGSGETLTGYDFVLGDFVSFFYIDVVVIDMDGFEMPDVRVELYSGLGSGDPLLSDFTDMDGYVSFSPEEPGMYTLRVNGYTTEPMEWTVTVDEESPSAFVEFTVIEDPVYRLFIFSMDSSGVPYPDLDIDWRHTGHSEWHDMSTGMDGAHIMESDSAISIELRPVAEVGFSVTPVMTIISLHETNPTDTAMFTVVPVSGIEDESIPIELKLSAYPNPFNASVEITNPNEDPVFIYDSQGRLVDIVHGNHWCPSTQSGTYTATAGGEAIKLFYVK